MIRVHHLNNSRSQRVLWLLEEIGEPYEIVPWQRDARTNLAPPGLRAIHPLGKSPMIEDGGRVLIETGAIVEHLVATRAPHLAPPTGTGPHDRYRTWLHYAEGSMQPLLLLKLMIDRLAPDEATPAGAAVMGFVRGNLALHLDWLEGEMAGAEWFAGDAFSGADVMMSFPLEAASVRCGLDGSRPALWSFLQRIHARPAWRRAVERGGEYSFEKPAHTGPDKRGPV